MVPLPGPAITSQNDPDLLSTRIAYRTSAKFLVNPRENTRFVPSTGIGFMRPFYDPLVRGLASQRLVHGHLLAQVAALQLGTGDIVDVGCGSGTLAIEAAKRFPGSNISGVDVDPRMLKQARKKPGCQRITLVHSSATELPFNDQTVDTVLCSLLLHHLESEEKLAALLEAGRILRPGGILLLADYCAPASRFARLRFLVVQLLDGWRRTRGNIRGELPTMIKQAGFEPPQEFAQTATPLGTVRCYKALRTAPSA